MTAGYEFTVDRLGGVPEKMLCVYPVARDSALIDTAPALYEKSPMPYPPGNVEVKGPSESIAMLTCMSAPVHP